MIIAAGCESGAVSQQPAGVFTEIHYAAATGNYEQVKAILARTPSAVNARGKDGLTPLQLAANNGHKEVVELLLANKAAINAKDNEGRTALHFAARMGNVEMAELLIRPRRGYKCKR